VATFCFTVSESTIEFEFNKMASAFAHSLVALTLGKTFPSKTQKFKFFVLGIFCATSPDLDVFMHSLGYDYSHVLGHRGFFHSLLFSLVLAIFIKIIFYYKTPTMSKLGLILVTYFFICAASHGLLDAMTTGGKGVAFFAPFDNARHFLPWRVIRVSPMSVSQFFGEWGVRVLKSEAYWIGIPCLAILFGNWVVRKIR